MDLIFITVRPFEIGNFYRPVNQVRVYSPFGAVLSLGWDYHSARKLPNAWDSIGLGSNPGKTSFSAFRSGDVFDGCSCFQFSCFVMSGARY